ncbi:putative absent in melanoma 1 protein-like [Scophthalmus maximus]|uniref:Putative absent in melanoma 1 protein-like n=1 Tax=Scophthalmus maximus TaxID=52904 RepID=A0A2U9D0F3_SCOMX|nr:putative absent in melanoma 1 protein-like [Scophthalmus maximus]
MAKKGSSRKSLKSLFSRSEAHLDRSAERDANKGEGEKKRFKLFHFKRKSRGESLESLGGVRSQSSMPLVYIKRKSLSRWCLYEHSESLFDAMTAHDYEWSVSVDPEGGPRSGHTHRRRHPRIAAEANNTAEDGEAWADNIVPDSKRPSRYATAPRSKGKEFSYSELDLRKPKRFATFSFGLRKRKKKDEENISKSTFGLHSSVIDEDGETTLDLSQVELDQGNVKTMFSMSQPELDTCQKFDIPSPPPAATNQSESHLTVPDQSRPLVTVNTQPESQGRPKGSDLADVHWDVPEAPIASIPELRLDDEEVGIPVYNKSTRRESPAPLTHGESVPVADTQAAPGLPARQPPGAHNAAADESARASPGPRDNDILHQSRTITETPPPESTGVPVSYHRPEAPDGADTATPGGERSPATAQRAASPAGSSERRPRPYSQNVLYGALYDSLFPQSFTSEVMSSLPNPPPPIHTERRRLTSTKSEPVMVKTRDECHTETNVTYSRPSSTRDPAARRAQDAEGRPAADSKADASSESSGFSFSQSSAAADYQPDADIRHRYRPSSPRSTSGPVGEDSPYSELTRSLPEVKSDRCSLVRDAVPVVQNSAPPASDCVTSPGPETRVTDCKPRVILVKETVTDEASADSGCPAPVPDKMSAVDGLEIQIGATESFYAASGSGTTEGSDGLLSPAYLSVGSDDGSAMEVYYSAEENGAEESGDEEMYTMYEREDVRAAGGAHEMDWGETAERGGSKRDGGDFRVVTVQMRNEGGNTGDAEDKEEDLSGQTGAQQRPGGQAEEAPALEDLVSDDASRHERESAAAALPQITEEEGEEEVGGRKEQVLATPVQLVNTVMDQQTQPGARGLNLPLRASAANSIVMRKSSDSSPEDLASPVANGNGMLPTGSRLDNSVIFKSYRSSSIDQTAENGTAHRPLFRTNSLPDAGPPIDRPSGAGPKEFGDPAASRFERFPFLANSTSPSLSGSLTGAEDPSFRLTRPAALSFGAPPSSDSPTRLLSPTSSIDHHRPFTTTDSPFSSFSPSLGMGMGMGMGAGAGTQGPPILQRSFSSEGSVGVQHTSLFNSFHGSSLQQSKEPEPDKGLVTKYRAFPDAYLTKEKEHGKLNPRPGKMYIFDQPGMCGQRFEVRSDVVDATSWELQETISIRVVRGGWVLYEKPNFKGEKFALDEGDIELTNPFSPPEEEEVNGQREAGEQNGDPGDERTESAPARRFIVGSLRRAVRDYSVPEISLFPEENAEGKKVVFRDTSDDARIFGFPVKATSIIINAGLWLVYAQPFFQGVPRVLEVGGYSNPAAWGVEQPYVGSLHPLKVGEPRVENTSEPKLVIHDKPYFCGKSRTITANMRDFMTRTDQQQATFMYNVGSLKVQGGIWVGYEKEGFRGHQYLLEEGDYQDWRVWGGRDAELRSVRLIRADLSDPLMVMFEQPEEEQEAMPEENTFEVTEAIPDVELFGYKTSTRSIHVLSGAWVAYSHVDFSGNQYILEKGFYNNSADWGSLDTRICSVQPILLAPCDNSRTRNEIVLYSEPDFQGQCHLFDRNQEAVSERFLTKSCRVAGGSWVLYDNKQYSGSMYVLHEGDYPNLTSMGCPAAYAVRSVKAVPTAFAVPSLSLFGLECLEGREITTETEILSMAGEGFNNHFLSVRVNSGCWVICEYSNYRGRQFFLEPIEITNWPKFSSLHTIGSVYPVKQGHRVFRVKNQESGLFLCVQGGVEEMKSGRVVVAAEAEPMSDMWFYQDGLVKSKLSQTMSLQVMGNIEPAAKVVLWTETRQPIQTWKTQMRGLITSLTFSGMVLDVKGGKTYDKDHVVIMPENDERPSQQWEIEFV